MPVTLNRIGKSLTSSFAFVAPEDYQDQPVIEFHAAGKLTIGAGDNGKVYDMNLDGPVSPTVIDGTNNVSMFEINVSANDYVAPSGTDDEIEISIYNTGSADATAIGSLSASSFLVTKFRLLQGSRTIPIAINKWGKGRFKMAVNSVGANKTYQIDAKFIYIDL